MSGLPPSKAEVLAGTSLVINAHVNILDVTFGTSLLYRLVTAHIHGDFIMSGAHW